ncbi:MULTISPECIES: pyridoxamine 5'-phosphate oxidase family protein [Bacillus]|uniref:pyridoxamine 5'-phosphate oxidase family protein n=1 Tax=Bacillus TaxID=1386 RepID=UPI00030BC124|nr:MULTISPECIES: pyridoxamine 5'-phosphate oxidase family protein [Bacillus]
MANIVEKKLIQPLFEALQKERYLLLTTIDPNTGAPNVNAISWAIAKDPSTLLFSLTSRSKLVENIRQVNHVVITLITNESTYAISGEAHIITEKLEDISLDLTLIEMRINEVRDVMFYGSKISVEPQIEKTYDNQAADILDEKVLEAMRKV